MMRNRFERAMKFISIQLALALIFSLFPTFRISANAYTAHTADEAIAWAQSKVGQSIDVDGAFGAQCVDLIMAYYEYLGVSRASGDGRDYATNALPAGWQRIEGAQPQKGDVLVYLGNSSNPSGHVAIYESDYVTYNGRYNHQGVVQKVTSKYNSFSNPYWGVVRPDFGSSSDNTDLDAGAYIAYAVGTNGSLAVNDWAAPSPSGSNEISSIPEGAACTVYTKRSIGNWYCVVYNGVCGYAYGAYLTTTNPNPAPAPVTPTTYTVSFDANGGSGAPASQTKTAGSAITLSRTCPTRLDYEFLGWSTSSTATSATWNPGGTYSDDASATLYAVWRYRTFTITFDSDGGNITLESQVKHFGQALKLSDTVLKKTFTASLDANGGTVSENEKNYSVEQSCWINAPGVQGPGVREEIGATLPADYLSNDISAVGLKELRLIAVYKMVKAGTLPTPTRQGYQFDGWYTEASNGKVVTESTYISLSQGTTLYAHWTKGNTDTFNISYNANGGSGAPATLEEKADEAITISSAAPTKTISLSFNANGGSCASNVKAVACSFKGWNTRADGSGTSYNSGANYSGNDDLTLYAQWNNPTVGSILPAAVRSGYSFDGWYTQAVGGKQIESGSTLSTSMTLYAHWTQQEKTNFFTDVDESDFYYQPVLWAAEKGITSGTSATTFSPESYCTRAQVVTFLWRAKGCPAPSSYTSKFTDVTDNGGYSAQAIIWATENGIASGVSATHFAPNESITRGQFVTFLWRSASQPDVSGTNPFSDLSASSYYYKSVMWAYENGITTGTSSTTFSPDSVCTRGQVVTFLYRNLGE